MGDSICLPDCPREQDAPATLVTMLPWVCSKGLGTFPAGFARDFTGSIAASGRK